MAFDMGAWRKAQMQAQDAKLQTSTHAPTQETPGGGFVSEVSALNQIKAPAAVATRKGQATRRVKDNAKSRRNAHRKLQQAMAVYAMTSNR